MKDFPSGWVVGGGGCGGGGGCQPACILLGHKDAITARTMRKRKRKKKEKKNKHPPQLQRATMRKQSRGGMGS